MKQSFVILAAAAAVAVAGNVYVCEYEYQADLKIFVVDYEYQADLCVYFVENEYQAGWEGGNKWQQRHH